MNHAFSFRLGLCAGLVGLVCFAALSQAGNNTVPEESKSSIVGKKTANFVLADTTGKQVALTDFADTRNVVLFFMGTGCPISNLYLKELVELDAQQADLQVIGIQSNAGLTTQQIAEHAKEYNVTFPVLLDEKQRVADSLGATRTAEVLLLDEQRVVRYHGRIDDRFGYTHKNPRPRRQDLKEAIAQLQAGNEIAVASTEPAGCLITHDERPAGHTAITYAKEISRIVQARCHECHRAGMVAPFELMSYDDVVDNSAMIKEVIVEKRMPPWSADPRYGHFVSNRNMPQEEVDLLVEWIDSGMPLGDKSELPPEPEYAEGWVIGKPDLVFELPEPVTVPADGVVPYLYFSVPTNFTEDVYVQAAEARPDQRAVVHHIIVTCRAPGADRREGGYLCGTAPGDPPVICPPGVARKIPAGSELVFQMHYTPSGKECQDRSQVGFILYKGDEPPQAILKTKGISNHEFEIPPHAAHHQVESSFTFKQDVQLLAFMPHMHLRGKDFMYTAVFPDGRNEVLLSVPVFDFNWQNRYELATPLTLPKGSRLDCLAHFDNSSGNAANPNPEEAVKWGPQTWEEMMIGWINYIPLGPAEQPAPEAAAENEEQTE